MSVKGREATSAARLRLTGADLYLSKLRRLAVRTDSADHPRRSPRDQSGRSMTPFQQGLPTGTRNVLDSDGLGERTPAAECLETSCARECCGGVGGGNDAAIECLAEERDESEPVVITVVHPRADS